MINGLLEQQGNGTFNSQSVWWSCIWFPRSRVERWTNQRDSQGGDFKCWTVFSLAFEQPGHWAACGWMQWTERLFVFCFYQLYIPGHICMHVHTHRHTHTNKQTKHIHFPKDTHRSEVSKMKWWCCMRNANHISWGGKNYSEKKFSLWPVETLWWSVYLHVTHERSILSINLTCCHLHNNFTEHRDWYINMGIVTLT